MALGSGQFSSQRAQKPHLLRGSGGVASEIGDVRDDIAADFAANAAIAVEEFTNVAAAVTDAFASITDAALVAGATISGSGLDGSVGQGTLDPPRNVTITISDVDTFVPTGNVVFNGVDINGDVITETFLEAALQAGAGGTIAGLKAFASVTSIVVPAMADGGGETLDFGFGARIGLGKPIKTRAGAVSIIKEHAVGAVVTNGAVATAAVGEPHGTYTPNSAPNGTNDYMLMYEYDATANRDA